MGHICACEWWYSSHNIFHPTIFDLIDGPNQGNMILELEGSKMYSIWLAKQASKFCGTEKKPYWRTGYFVLPKLQHERWMCFPSQLLSKWWMHQPFTIFHDKTANLAQEIMCSSGNSKMDSRIPPFADLGHMSPKMQLLVQEQDELKEIFWNNLFSPTESSYLDRFLLDSTLLCQKHSI